MTTARPTSSSATAASASSANDARQPVAASRGRRTTNTRQEGSCPCAMDCAGVAVPGVLIHHHPDCRIFQAITETPHLCEQTIACAVLAIQSYIRLYQNVVELRARDLSLRQHHCNLANLRESLDVIERATANMKNDMPLVAQRDGAPMKGAQS